MSRTKVVIYIDDLPKDLEKYGKLLSNGFTVKPTEPIPFDDLWTLLEPNLEALIADYRLFQGKLPDGKHTPYDGAQLAASFRKTLLYGDKRAKGYAPGERPVILILAYKYGNTINEKITLESISKEVIHTLYKEEIKKDPKKAQQQIIGLINGFRTLRNVKPDERSPICLLNLLGIPEIISPQESLWSANPPFRAFPSSDLRSEDHYRHRKDYPSWDPFNAASWVVKVLMEYPGILYDELYTASKLGISLKTFQKEEVRKLFDKAKYSGLFHELGDYWWKDGVIKIGYDLLEAANLYPDLSPNFSDCLSKMGIDAEQPICCFSGKPGADKICYILREPVKKEYALRYYIYDRPTIMDGCFISMKAYLQSDAVILSLIPPEDREKARKIIETRGQPSTDKARTKGD